MNVRRATGVAATSVMQPKDVSFGSHFYVYTVILPNLSFVLYKCIHPYTVGCNQILTAQIKTRAERECVDWKPDKLGNNLQHSNELFTVGCCSIDLTTNQ